MTGRNVNMQFSLRRMLLAVAVFAAILGMFVLYAKSRGMFDSTNDPTYGGSPSSLRHLGLAVWCFWGIGVTSAA